MHVLTYFSLFMYLLLYDGALSAVSVIGIFPYAQDSINVDQRSLENIHWSNQCIAMMIAAMQLAEKYNFTVRGQPINYAIHRTKNSANGFGELDLVCNAITTSTTSDILGIIGPTSSTATRFVGMLAAQLNIPLIAYSATNNELSNPQHYPTLFRIAPSDSFLAKAIVQLFKFFSWETCNLILGNDDFGYGGLKILTEEYHANITLKERIIFDPQRNQFHIDLAQTIKRSWSRIVLVWANQSSLIAIIQHALNEKLLGGKYIWILNGQVNSRSLPFPIGS